MEQRHKILSRANLTKVVLVFVAPLSLVISIGLINFGTEFFSINHWIVMRGVFVPPIIGIIAISILLCYYLIFVNNLLNSKGVYIELKDNILIINHRKKFLIKDICIGTIKICGSFENVLSFYYGGKEVRVPLFFSRETPSDILELIRKELAVSS